MRNVTMKQVELEVANMELVAEYKEAMAVKDNNWAIEVAMDILFDARVRYAGYKIVAKKDSILLLDGEAKQEAIVAEELEVELKAKRSAGIVKYAKEGVGYAVNAMNGAINMEEVIRYFNGKEIAGAYVKPVGVKGSAVSNVAGTGRRSKIVYTATKIVDGNFVLVSAKEKAVKKENKKQVASVIYVEGDKGYTAPKGKATPKQVKNKKAVVVLPEVKENIEVMIPMNLQLCASGSASTSQTNNTNTNNRGEGKMKRNLNRASIALVATELNGREISTSRQFNEAFKLVNYKKAEKPVHKAFNLSNKLDKDGNGLSNISNEMGTNSFLSCDESIVYHTKEQTITVAGYPVKVGEGTGKLVTTDFVTFNCKNVESGTEQDMIDRVIAHGLYRCGDDIFFPAMDKGVKVYRKNAPSGKIVYASDFVGKTLSFYRFLNASPSQARKGDGVLLDGRKFTAEDVFEIQDRLVGGALSYALAPTHAEKEVLKAQGVVDMPKFTTHMNADKADKITPRLAQQNTASVTIGLLGNDKYGVMILLDALTNDSDYNKETNEILVDEYGVDIDNQILDGQAYGNAQGVVDMCADAGINVSLKAIVGNALQARVKGLNTKEFPRFASPKEFAEVIKNLKVKYKDNYIVVGNPDNIVYVCDDNAAKLVNSWRCDKHLASKNGVEYGNFELCFLANPFGSTANTSAQLLTKVFNDEVAEEILGLYTDALMSSLNRIATGSLELDSKCARTQKLFAANPERSTASIATQSMLIGEITSQGHSMIRNVKIPVNGFNLNAFFDNTHLITGNDSDALLRRKGDIIEAYSKSVNKANRVALNKLYADYVEELDIIETRLDGLEIDAVTAETLKVNAKLKRTAKVDKIMTSVTVKYPCPTDIEFAIFRYLADFEITEAVEERISAKPYIKELVRRMFLDLKEGIVMIAALNTLKHRLAGMDTDFDSIVSFFNASMVKSAMDKNEGIAVFIDKDKNGTSKSMFKQGNKLTVNETVVASDDELDI